jgi:hypothetical protein
VRDREHPRKRSPKERIESGEARFLFEVKRRVADERSGEGGPKQLIGVVEQTYGDVGPPDRLEREGFKAEL